MDEVVWLHEYRCFAFLVFRGAFFSTVNLPGQGRLIVENDDYDLWEERAIEYESDDGG
jgi:hypothetical protein